MTLPPWKPTLRELDSFLDAFPVFDDDDDDDYDRYVDPNFATAVAFSPETHQAHQHSQTGRLHIVPNDAANAFFRHGSHPHHIGFDEVKPNSHHRRFEAQEDEDEEGGHGRGSSATAGRIGRHHLHHYQHPSGQDHRRHDPVRDPETYHRLEAREEQEEEEEGGHGRGGFATAGRNGRHHHHPSGQDRRPHDPDPDPNTYRRLVEAQEEEEQEREEDHGHHGSATPGRNVRHHHPSDQDQRPHGPPVRDPDTYPRLMAQQEEEREEGGHGRGDSATAGRNVHHHGHHSGQDHRPNDPVRDSDMYRRLKAQQDQGHVSSRTKRNGRRCAKAEEEEQHEYPALPPVRLVSFPGPHAAQDSLVRSHKVAAAAAATATALTPGWKREPSSPASPLPDNQSVAGFFGRGIVTNTSNSTGTGTGALPLQLQHQIQPQSGHQFDELSQLIRNLHVRQDESPPIRQVQGQSSQVLANVVNQTTYNISASPGDVDMRPWGS